MNSFSSHNDLLEDVQCNLCGANDYSVIYPARYDSHETSEDIMASFRSSGDEILSDQLVRCNQCSLQYLNPRLKHNLILEGYSSGTDENFVSQAAAREKTFAKCLDIIEKQQPTRGRILDVGTAGGSFLHVAKTRGWSVLGCEPSKWLCQWAKDHYGLELTPGTIFDMSIEDNSLDVVTLWDVLEHTPDPRKVLQECHRILKPKGLLVVNYPDIASSVAKMMGRKWVFLLSVHLYYFTVSTIVAILQQLGFDIIRRQKHWQSLELDYIFFRMTKYIPVLPQLGRKVFGFLRMQHVNIPYWMGQVLVLVRKK